MITLVDHKKRPKSGTQQNNRATFLSSGNVALLFLINFYVMQGTIIEKIGIPLPILAPADSLRVLFGVYSGFSILSRGPPYSIWL